jgi:hypothetical protein
MCFLSEKLEPRLSESITDIFRTEPAAKRPKQLTELPIRAEARIDSEEDIETKFRAEKPLPMLTYLLTEMAEPSCTAFKHDIIPPVRSMVRIERLEPRLTPSRAENLPPTREHVLSENTEPQ